MHTAELSGLFHCHRNESLMKFNSHTQKKFTRKWTLRKDSQ